MEPSIDRQQLERTRSEAVPRPLLKALAETPAYLVGGAVRDALIGREVGDLDIVVEGELGPILERLGVEARNHKRFATASVELGGRTVDLARSRRETYARPGALPEVSPAPIRADLARRDFTINAIAVPLAGELDLLDPYDGVGDIGAGLLRVIHSASFEDDPTRALRAARYAARFGFELEGETERLLRGTDLGAVSADRVRADLLRIAAEPQATTGFELLRRWGLLELDPPRLELLERAEALLDREPWASAVGRSEALLDLATAEPGRLEAATELAAAAEGPMPNSELFELAAGYDDGVLLIARASGAERLDQLVGDWRRLRLSIDGGDLLAAGVPEGPGVGAALRAVLHARIDGRLEAGREAELALALASADLEG